MYTHSPCPELLPCCHILHAPNSDCKDWSLKEQWQRTLLQGPNDASASLVFCFCGSVWWVVSQGQKNNLSKTREKLLTQKTIHLTDQESNPILQINTLTSQPVHHYRSNKILKDRIGFPIGEMDFCVTSRLVFDRSPSASTVLSWGLWHSGSEPLKLRTLGG